MGPLFPADIRASRFSRRERGVSVLVGTEFSNSFVGWACYMTARDWGVRATEQWLNADTAVTGPGEQSVGAKLHCLVRFQEAPSY